MRPHHSNQQQVPDPQHQHQQACPLCQRELHVHPQKLTPPSIQGSKSRRRCRRTSSSRSSTA